MKLNVKNRLAHDYLFNGKMVMDRGYVMHDWSDKGPEGFTGLVIPPNRAASTRFRNGYGCKYYFEFHHLISTVKIT